jgi:RNA polymerase sigma-70 factor (ECF subfamily)
VAIVGGIAFGLGTPPSAPWPQHPLSGLAQGLSFLRSSDGIEPPPELDDAAASAENDAPFPSTGKGGEAPPDGRHVTASLAEEPGCSAGRNAENSVSRDTDLRGTARSATYSAVEGDLVGRARAALYVGNAVQARALLESHARDFPDGQLAPERDVLLTASSVYP